MFTIHGQTIAKKNARNLFIQRGRIINIPSKSYAVWHKDACKQLMAVPKVKEYPVEIIFTFFFKDNRRRDMDNTISSVMDVMTDCHILEDDDVKHVSVIHSVYKGVDKLDPRVEVEIRKIGTV